MHGEGKPFFTLVWFGSCHTPYSGLAEDVAAYKDVAHEPTRNRFAEITAMDRAVGSLRKTLRDLKVADNTLVWYCSDNGIGHDPKQSFNGGWREKKGSIYEGGLRIPGIIEWPAVVKSPRKTSVACVTTDIFPTVLDFLGLSSPDAKRPLDGVSLRKLIADNRMTERPQPIGFWKYPANSEQKNERWMDPVLTRGTTPTTSQAEIDFKNFKHPAAKTEGFGGDAAWTENRYKLVEIGEGRRKAPTESHLELYDLLADPREEHDIAAQNPQVVQRMSESLRAWQRSVEVSLTGADYRAAK